MFHSIAELGITSTFLPDISESLPANTSFICTLGGTGAIFTNTNNKIPSSGVLSIDKADSGGYVRVMFTASASGLSCGKIYLCNIDMNAKAVNGWYKFEGALV